MSVKWIITGRVVDESTGGVLSVTWEATYKNYILVYGNENIAYKSGECIFTPDATSPSFIPYKELNEPKILSWVYLEIDKNEVDSEIEGVVTADRIRVSEEKIKNSELHKAVIILHNKSVVVNEVKDELGNLVYDTVIQRDDNGYSITSTRVPQFESDGVTIKKDVEGNDITVGGEIVTEQVVRTQKSWLVSDEDVLAELIEPTESMNRVSFADFAEACIARGVSISTIRDITNQPEYLKRIEGYLLVGDIKSLETWLRILPSSISGTAGELTKLRNTVDQYRLRNIDLILRKVYRDEITLEDVKTARKIFLQEL